MVVQDVAVIAPSDRTDLLPGLLLAHESGTFPTLAGVILTGPGTGGGPHVRQWSVANGAVALRSEFRAMPR